jgi:hypothetical protein
MRYKVATFTLFALTGLALWWIVTGGVRSL